MLFAGRKIGGVIDFGGFEYKEKDSAIFFPFFNAPVSDQAPDHCPLRLSFLQLCLSSPPD